MKRPNPLIIPATLLLLGITLDSFAGSANLSNYRIMSLLSAAGFQIRTGPDAESQLWYLRATPNTLERHVGNGGVVYTYTDPRAGFMYIGGPPEYRQFNRVMREVSFAQGRLQPNEAVYKSWQDWNWTWKPWKLWVWSYQDFGSD